MIDRRGLNYFSLRFQYTELESNFQLEEGRAGL